MQQTDAEWGDKPKSAWRAPLLGAFEFVVAFVGALLLAYFLPAEIKGAYPSPLWIPVIFLSLQYGTLVGLAGAVVASAIFFSQGLPTEILSEDIYQYMSRVGIEPIGWITVALLIGHVRDRQVRERTELLGELTERDRQCRAVAGLCDELRSRAQTLERQIAANPARSPADIVEAISGLHDASAANLAERLGRFIFVMTGASDFALYLLRDDELKITAREGQSESFAASLSACDALFGAVVNSQRTLLSERVADRDLLARRNSIIGPLMDRSSSDRVIGALWVSGSNLAETPRDIEQVFTLTCTEISRSLLRNAALGLSSLRLIEGVPQATALKPLQSRGKADRREIRAG